ncbi:hypothetical protein SAMD00019534_110420 [Acytostelium subglobosum LB1]|uniref:hypothetical protein n=1 Tax=Acytostelium subglobosum LB1 TaxID=1410327 RepID=UPI000644E71D|nr:hypothetical protein SAMD00019534_110420 [Acytostelium subglobosum LB1]GAM27866.1 hypothetical protein SAMD00019534_110420 [Acytostelium subglobosum LB1]|eukprot:XP_012749149.1 hypothetical protein SAMD00019534_110420 [Acytostelium subglobosum LB1]
MSCWNTRTEPTLGCTDATTLCECCSKNLVAPPSMPSLRYIIKVRYDRLSLSRTKLPSKCGANAPPRLYLHRRHISLTSCNFHFPLIESYFREMFKLSGKYCFILSNTVALNEWLDTMILTLPLYCVL